MDESSTIPTPQEPAKPGIERPRLAKNLAALMSSQVITWTIATVVAIALPRFIGPASLGQLRLAGSVWAIASLFVGLGTTIYITLEFARDEARARHLVGTVLIIRTIAFAVVSTCITVLAVSIGINRELAILLLVGGVSTFGRSFGEIFGSALTGLEQMSYVARATVISKFVYAGALLPVLFLGGGVVAIATTALIGSVVGAVILVYAYYRLEQVSTAGWRGRWRKVLRGSRVFLVAGGALVLYQQIDTIVMAVLVDPTALGWYTTADTLFSSLLFVPAILMAAVFPRMSRLHTLDPPALEALVSQSFSSLMLLGVPIGLGTVVVAPEFALLLFGDDYVESGAVLQVFGLVIPLVFGTILFGGVARATDRQRFWIFVVSGAIVLTIPLDILLVPWADSRFENGAIGGALAYLVTESIMFGIGVWWISPSLLKRPTVIRTGKVLLSGGVMFAAIWPLRHLIFIATAAVGVAVYFVMIRITSALTGDERAKIGELRARLSIRRG